LAFWGKKTIYDNYCRLGRLDTFENLQLYWQQKKQWCHKDKLLSVGSSSMSTQIHENIFLQLVNMRYSLILLNFALNYSRVKNGYVHH
jgi:hypothetical protein